MFFIPDGKKTELPLLNLHGFYMAYWGYPDSFGEFIQILIVLGLLAHHILWTGASLYGSWERARQGEHIAGQHASEREGEEEEDTGSYGEREEWTWEEDGKMGGRRQIIMRRGIMLWVWSPTTMNQSHEVHRKNRAVKTKRTWLSSPVHVNCRLEHPRVHITGLPVHLKTNPNPRHDDLVPRNPLNTSG